jgi:hypothetical protein
LPSLLAAGVRVEVWGWKRCGGRWHVRREAIQPGDLETIVVSELSDGRRKNTRKAEAAGRPSDEVAIPNAGRFRQ